MKHEDIAAFAAQSRAVQSDLAASSGRISYPFENDEDPGFARADFRVAKRAFDIGMSVLLLPLLGLSALMLLLLNPIRNPGPILFIQERMGRDCKPFRAIKFRTMTPADRIMRSANCPIETDRITSLGRFLRKSRIDELPQVLNVLRGEMSLIGPRPDYYEHACHFLAEVPGYKERHMVRPGISGLAQTEVGYVSGVDATRRKVQADLHYINHSGFRLEAWIIWRTLAVIFKREGA